MIVKAVLARDDTSKTGFDLERGMLQGAECFLGPPNQEGPRCAWPDGPK